MFSRHLLLEKTKSYLILGPRQCGKSTMMRDLLTAEDLYINLLPQAEYLKYSKDPARFHQELRAHAKSGKSLCVIDEIQRIPDLLNDVHDLIESTSMSFIMTGSSARKLREKGVNLLAGRALSRSIYPLTYSELKGVFDLEAALIYGTLPKIWNSDLSSHADKVDFLNAYSQVYLQEEIQQEGLVRKIGSFPRFLDIAAINDGQIVNYSTVARDCAVSSKTIQNYYQILEDTFLAHRIDGWSQSVRRQLTAHPKYYFFDCGITNALCLSLKEQLNAEERGRRFEQFVILQIIAFNAYKQKGYRFYHWRDKNGAAVDLLLVQNNQIKAALEFKSSASVNAADAKALESFRSEYGPIPSFVLGVEGNKRELRDGVLYLRWDAFLEEHFDL